jgi:3',5'-cyclic-AMP phosphodiesterase
VIVQLSDLHVGASGATDPVEDARRALRAVASLQPAPAGVLISGDLADHGSPDEYASVRSLVAGLQMPVRVLPGNHDDREALRAAFPLAEPSPPDRYRWAAHFGDLRVIACDTAVAGRDDGRLDALELAWLEEQLAGDSTTPTIVAMHHLPVEMGMPVLDEIGMSADDRAALVEILSRAPQVRRIVCGHVHMPITAELGGVPVVSSPSTWRYRPRLDFGATTFDFTELPAGMLIHALVNGELVSFVQPIG